ncbi:hypothetical protein HKCCE4037_13420 [Rhodobacterales bacterium HKCCE4037]|nr:hypothetical protein [Rhodobacterales bacterium HKCCE4037]
MPDLKTIESELERDRAALRAEIAAVGEELRPARIVETVASQIGLGRSGVGPILSDPKMPMALTGLGLSWLTANLLTRRPAPRPAAVYDDRPTHTAPGFRDTRPEPASIANFDARVRAADAADTAGRFGTETYNSEGEPLMSTDIQATNPTLRDRAYASVDSLKSRIEDGLEHLPDAAKSRIRAAREAAIEAHGQVEYHARRTATAARQTARENPLLVGALAFAAGALVAATLPRTSAENRAVGAHRDRLFDEADRVFREEVEKAKLAARDAVAKGEEHVKEQIEAAADSVGEAAKNAKSGSSSSTRNGSAHA